MKSGICLLVALLMLIGLSGAQAQQATKGILVIQSTPGGAQVYVDDEPMGTTSAAGRLKLSLTPGKHSLRLSLAGYVDWKGTATLTEGRTTESKIGLSAHGHSSASQTSANGPSLEETLSFIEQALSSYGSVDRPARPGYFEQSFSNKFSSIDSCRQIVVNTVRTTGSTPNVEYYNQATINLANADPSSIKLSELPHDPGEPAWGYFLTLKTTNLSNSVIFEVPPWRNLQTGQTGSGTGKSEQAAIGIYMSDQETGERVAKALTRAVELCGGKKSSF